VKRSYIKHNPSTKRQIELKKDKEFQVACLQRDRYRCQAPGCNILAQAVHHMIHRRFKAVRHYPLNGVSLCSGCHREIHEGKNKDALRLAIINNKIGIQAFDEMRRNAQNGIHME
jgi:hypothetical protein